MCLRHVRTRASMQFSCLLLCLLSRTGNYPCYKDDACKVLANYGTCMTTHIKRAFRAANRADRAARKPCNEPFEPKVCVTPHPSTLLRYYCSLTPLGLVSITPTTFGSLATTTARTKSSELTISSRPKILGRKVLDYEVPGHKKFQG